MSHQPSQDVSILQETLECTGWPRSSARDVTVLCGVELQLEERTVSLVRVLSCDPDIVVQAPVWSRTYDVVENADDAFAALNSKPRDLLHWSVGAAAFGPAWLDTTIGDLVSSFVEERDEERERVASELEKERLRLEEERTAETRIDVYFREKKGRYLLVLERGSIKAKPIWTISFEESWERDRFWDWLAWQTESFEEFAEFMQGGCRLELERRLLREMLVTEQAVKKQGLGSGGRRPLRFWRGEL